jgi:hypothetical protein
VESGQIFALAHSGIGGRIGGPIGGRMVVESGQLERIRNLPQTKAAQREAGRKNVESGHMERIRNLPQAKAAQREAGKKAGRIAVESGHLDRVRTKESCSEGGRAANHNRWHANKGIEKVGCRYCEVVRPELSQVGFADSFDAVRDAVRHAVADGHSQKDILAAVALAVTGLN